MWRPGTWTKRDWYPPNPAPPQAQCTDPEPHDRHLFEHSDNGLIWSCQGRRARKVKPTG